VIPSDNWQADAAAIYTRRLHITRCLIVHDGDVFGVGLARAFRAAARKQGIKITGLVRWKAVARNYKSLFKTAKAKHPDCVYLSGSADSNGARLLHDKVKYLGSNTKIRLIAPDGFLGYPDIDALKAARGMYVTTSGVTLHRIHARGGAGAAFIDAFKARFGHAPDSGFVLYGAAAYQLILDAVAASDGTHDDVRAKLFSGLTVPADRSVLGLPFGIDKVTGDATLKEITIVRLSGGKELDWGYVTLPS
jgi:branched-chain amino acid transport system substrate-binding protein